MKVTEQDMVETFVRPFEMCVKDGDVSSIMCSYNRVNGIPTGADPVLLKETIRQKWKFKGYIVSDCDSVEVMVSGHKYSDTPEDAVAQTLKAVRQGKVKEEDVDTALKYLYVVLMRLGFFDGSFLTLGKRDICSEEHIELAAEAARQGVVFLKNDGTLPLNTDAVELIFHSFRTPNRTTLIFNKRIKGILWVGHPGQEGGRAIADVIFRKYNPGGRLPITWIPNDYANKLPMTSMQLRPVDSLGYPINFTTVQLSFEVEVLNVGDRDGSDVIMCTPSPQKESWELISNKLLNLKEFSLLQRRVNWRSSCLMLAGAWPLSTTKVTRFSHLGCTRL
ncbi:hypothetical protein DITRI_Ditri09bG0159200 [Diplodiscus trichospermus]